MENITVMSQRSHDRWNLEMKGGPVGGEGRRGGGGGGGGGWSREGERKGDRGGVRAREGKGGRPVLFGPVG